MERFSFKYPSIYVLLAITAISILLFTQSAVAQHKEDIQRELNREITLANDFGIGARAQGMGGAFIGVANDSTALYWNPAGLSQIKMVEFYGALSHEKLETEATYFGETDSTFASNTHPNSFGIVLPVPTYQGGLAFALGVNRIQSFDSRLKLSGFNNATEIEDPEFFQLSVDQKSHRSGSLYSWDFGAAVDIAPGVSIGATIGVLAGDYSFELEPVGVDTKNIDPDVESLSYKYKIDRDYSGVEGKIGLLAQPIDQVRFGITVDIPLDFTVDEDWSQEMLYVFDDGTDEVEFDAGYWPYEISMPIRLGGGIAAYPLPWAVIAADVLYTDWTQTKYSDPPSDDVSNEDFIDDYRDTLQLRVGGEYTIPEMGFSIRAGYLLDPLPYTPKDVEIDTDRQFITFGLGMMMDNVLSLDVAYMRGFWKESISGGDIVKDRSSNRILISGKYRF